MADSTHIVSATSCNTPFLENIYVTVRRALPWPPNKVF